MSTVKPKKPKLHYRAYERWVVDNPPLGISRSDWTYIGDTYAVSEKKAFNNIMWRVNENRNSFQDLGHDMTGIHEYQVRLVTGDGSEIPMMTSV